MLTNMPNTQWRHLGGKGLVVVPSKLLNESFVMLLTLWKRRTHIAQTGVVNSKPVPFTITFLFGFATTDDAHRGIKTCPCPENADVSASELFWYCKIIERVHG